MIYVVPGAEHLYQMKAVLYDTPYKNPVQEVAYPGFRAIGEREVQGTITVPHDQLEALFAMTPLLLENAPRRYGPSGRPAGADYRHRIPVLAV